MSTTVDRRWPALNAACYGQILGGMIYLFGVYSEFVKQELFPGDRSAQSKVQFLATLSNLGTYLPICGFFYESKFGGPRNCTVIAIFMMITSYIVLYLTVSKRIEMSYGGLCTLFFFIGHGAQYFDSNITPTAAKNFPDHRGQAMGLTKATFGLSASILTIVYIAFFKDQVPEFMLFIAGFVAVVGFFIVLPFLRLVPPDPTLSIKAASKRFKAGFLVVIAWSLWLMFCSIMKSQANMPPMVAFAGDAIAFVLLSVPSWNFLFKEDAVAVGEDDTENDYEALVDKAAPSSDAPEDGPSNTAMPVSMAMNLPKAMRTINFYCLWITLLAGFGGGLTITNNSTQIFKALGQESNKDVAVSLVSVLNCFGRIVAGVVSDYLLNSYGLSRPYFLAGASAINMFCFLLLSTGSAFGLYVGCLTVGFTYGCFFAVGPAVASEAFGLKYFASIYGSYIFAAACGSFIFSTTLASFVYEANIQGDGGDCYGSSCYRVTFLVLAACAGVATLMSMLLARNMKAVYAAKQKGSH